MWRPEELSAVVSAAVLLDDAHLLLDVSAVPAVHWQPWLQLLLGRALCLGRATCPAFAVTPDTSAEELSSFIASYDIAKRQIVDRAEVAHRRTASGDGSGAVSEGSSHDIFRRRGSDTSFGTPHPDSDPPHSRRLHLSFEEGGSGTTGGPVRPSPRPAPASARERPVAGVGPTPAARRFAVLLCGLQCASPAVQRCLIDALQHRRVTVDGASVRLTGGLTVVGLVDAASESVLSHRLRERFLLAATLPAALAVAPAVPLSLNWAVPWDSQQRLAEVAKGVSSVAVATALESYARQIVLAIRTHVAVGLQFPQWQPVSAVVTVAQAWATLQDRPFAVPSDVQAAARVALPHRIGLDPRVTLLSDSRLPLAVQMDPTSTEAPGPERTDPIAGLAVVEAVLAECPIPV